MNPRKSEWTGLVPVVVERDGEWHTVMLDVGAVIERRVEHRFLNALLAGARALSLPDPCYVCGSPSVLQVLHAGRTQTSLEAKLECQRCLAAIRIERSTPE